MSNYQKMKKIIKEEFEWLMKNYPIGLFKKIDFKIYNIEDVKKLDMNKRNGFFIYDMEFFERCDIVLIYEEETKLNLFEKSILKKNEQKEKVYFYMLYHEYGHVITMEELYRKKNKEEVKRIFDEYGEKVESILQRRERGEITEEKEKNLYKKLDLEKEADLFANKLLKLREEKIKELLQQELE